MTSDIARLGRAIKARREELDMTQLDVWQADGPSNSTLTGLETGTAETVSRATLRKLDIALRWEPGSARRVRDGLGEPTPARLNLKTPIRPENVDRIRALIEADDTLSPSTRARLLGVLDERGEDNAGEKPTSRSDTA